MDNMYKSLLYFIQSVRKYQKYREFEQFDQSKIIDFQNEKLVKIVKYSSENVPYYGKKFAEIGLNIANFRGIEDVHKIPLLDKEVIRKNPEEFISIKAKKEKLNWNKTSGSTGTPLRLVLDDGIIINKYVASFRAYKWAGYNLGDVIFRISDVSPNLKTLYKYDRLTKTINYYSNQVSPHNIDVIATLLQKYKPKIFMGYGLSFLIMGRLLNEYGLNFEPPKAIINYGEDASFVKRELERLFNTKYFDFYSNTENVVLIHQCENNKMHIAEDFSYHEIVDDNENILYEGEGELVGTSFYNYSMPLIRYKTRDNVRVNNKICSCGRNSRVVENLIGRKDDFIVTPDLKYIFLGEGAISYSKNVIFSQYVQESIDELRINLVVDRDFNKDEFSMIELGLRERFGNSMKFIFNIVEELEKTKSGKTKFIISKIGNTIENI